MLDAGILRPCTLSQGTIRVPLLTANPPAARTLPEPASSAELVRPGFSFDWFAAANLHSFSYTSGKNCSAAEASPRSMRR